MASTTERNEAIMGTMRRYWLAARAVATVQAVCNVGDSQMDTRPGKGRQRCLI